MAEAASNLNFYFIPSQDTIPAKKTIDSLQGIDTALLRFEMRRAEVERQKQIASQKQIKTIVPKLEIDTSCFFCPTRPIIHIEESLISNLYINNKSGEDLLLGRSHFYQATKELLPVFAETKGKHTYKGDFPIEKPLKRLDLLPEISIVPSVLLLLLLIIIRRAFTRYILSLLHSTLKLYYAEKVYNEKSILGQNANVLLDLLYFLSVPFIVLYATNYLEPTIVEEIGTYWFLGYGFSILLGLRTFRFITIKTISYISDNRSELGFLYANQLMYSRIVGLILAPIVFLISYSGGLLQMAFLIIASVVIGLALIINQFRTVQVFIRKGFSIFYLLLYLCALEIIPLLIIYKELKGVD